VVERIQGDRKEEVRMWDRARRRLEKTRSETLTAIAVERSLFETMIQRAHASGLAIPDIAEGALVQLTTYETQAKTATDRDELERLEVRAIHQGELRAYICPGSEIKAEALLEIDLMEEWGVPPESMRAFRKAVEPGLASADVAVARGALRKVFEECDSWSDYVDEHYRTMRSSTVSLLVAIFLLTVCAIQLSRWPSGVLVACLFAGAAGGCASTIVWAPRLALTPSKELDSYKQRIFGRVGIAIATSFIGTAFLGWGLLPVSIQDETFSDIVNLCTAVPTTSCSGLRILILLGVSMAFGFSERALSRFADKLIR